MIYGLVCTRNEEHRYLEPMLRWHVPLLDGILVYDDGSTDGTVELARRCGAEVAIRPADVPPFMQHEAQFRAASWDAMCKSFSPTYGVDWAFCLDADEFFFSRGETEWEALARLTTWGSNSVQFRVEEIFGYEDGTPLRRIDGAWGTISARRLARIQENPKFAPRPMGGGSLPSFAVPAMDATNLPLGLLHYGYAASSDKVAKYERYSRKMNNGHASTHIESIRKDPTLESVGFHFPVMPRD